MGCPGPVLATKASGEGRVVGPLLQLPALPGLMAGPGSPLPGGQPAVVSGWRPGCDVSGGRTGAGTSLGTSLGTGGLPMPAGHWGAMCTWGWRGGHQAVSTAVPGGSSPDTKPRPRPWPPGLLT